MSAEPFVNHSKRENPRSGLHRRLMIFCPRLFCERVTEVTVADLQKMGVKAALLDLDNTLVGWQRHDVPDEIRQWLIDLKAADIKLCLISNTRFGRRLRALSEELDIPYVRRAWKPRKSGFLRAMRELGVDPQSTVMLGDQMFTDILGANRVGVYSIMVRPMARREFAGTKISRIAERFLMRWFRSRGYL